MVFFNRERGRGLEGGVFLIGDGEGVRGCCFLNMGWGGG